MVKGVDVVIVIDDAYKLLGEVTKVKDKLSKGLNFNKGKKQVA